MDLIRHSRESKATLETSSRPAPAAMNSGVAPFCGARHRVSNPPLHPTRCTALCAPLTSNRHAQEILTAPGPVRLSKFRGTGGSIAAMLAIRCAHLSQTRQVLLENEESRKGCLMYSHVGRVSDRVLVVVLSTEEQNQGWHNRRAT